MSRSYPFFIAVSMLVWGVVLLAQSSAARRPENSNGISVGEAKVFDNRTLTIMLDTLSASLSNTQVVDPKTLAAALGLLNGMMNRDSASNFTLTTRPTPQITTNAGNVDKNGVALPTTTQTSLPTVNPAIPALDAAAAVPGFNPSFGENASDLLTDQVNLQYQIFNLRMLLERSLSDRTLVGNGVDGKPTGGPRLQTVLGFNVSVDPPQTAKDSVAVVEVTLEIKDLLERIRAKEGLSLVGLMPQEKTYNAAAVSTKSRAFGGSAVVKMFQVSYNQRQKSQIFYLYRDSDTVSYELMSKEDKGKIVFGWMFRPVLGRRSVSPGLRQMFAIVALPDSDPRKLKDWSLNASVRTYWKKYDAATLTAFEERDAGRRSKFLYAVSAGLVRPQIFDARYVNNRDLSPIRVKSTSEYEADLLPIVTSAKWRPTGSKSVVVSVEGDNFYSGTQVILGDKTYATVADGLTIKSNQTFDIVTTLDAMAGGPAMILGRYGESVPIDCPSSRIAKARITNLQIGPDIAGGRALTIAFSVNQGQEAEPGRRMKFLSTYKEGGDKSYGPLGELPPDPLITLNGKLIPPPYDTKGSCGKDSADCDVTLVAHMDSSLFPGSGANVEVFWPFYKGWKASGYVQDPVSAYEVLRLGGNTVLVRAKDAKGFQPAGVKRWRVLDGGTVLPVPACDSCAAPDAPTGRPALRGKAGLKAGARAAAPCIPSIALISRNAFTYTFCDGVPSSIVLVGPDDFAFPLNVPKDSVPAPAAGPAVVTINQFDRVWIKVPALKSGFTKTVPGKNGAPNTAANLVSRVEANQLSLPFTQPDLNGTTPLKLLDVEITDAISAHPGDVQVTVLGADGGILGRQTVHIVCTVCKDGQR